MNNKYAMRCFKQGELSRDKKHACCELQASQRDPGGPSNMTSSLYLQKHILNLKVEVGRLVKNGASIIKLSI